MSAQDGASPAPGVYREDQHAGRASNLAEDTHNDAWLNGYRYALLNPDDPGVQADLARYQEEAQRTEAEQLREELTKAKAEQERLRKGWEQAYQQGWRQGQDQRLEWRRERDRAREQAAECMRETAQLHRQLDSLGTNPDRLAEQVGAGMAVTLFGRTYVDRDLLVQLAQDDDKQDDQAEGQLELLEADSGVFVPIPKGHMLSVTVTPYEDQPD